MLENILRDRSKNVEMCEDNEKLINKFYSQKVSYEIDSTKIYGDIPKKRPGVNTSPIIRVDNDTSLNMAMKYMDKKPLILNFASAIHPGGGYIRGANAQEECLCRSSTLYNVLKEFKQFYEFHKPLAGTKYSDLMIYSPSITFFKDDYGFKMNDVDIAVLTAAAPNNRTKETGADELRKIFLHRIRKVLLIAESNGHRAVMLGAWGCGAFACDPLIIAQAFKEVLDSDNWAFDVVAFPVADTKEEKTVSIFRNILL